MISVVVIGAGGHGQVVMDILQAMSKAGRPVIARGYLDDDARLHGSSPIGATVLGGLSELDRLPDDHIVVAIGDNSTRRRVIERLLDGGRTLFTAIHPSAHIAASSVVRRGAMICAGAVVSPASVLGQASILNTSASVDHHNQVGDYTHIGPGARLGGSVQIGEESLIGIGAIVMPNLRVGARTVIAAGAVVTKSFGDGVIAIGVPARTIVPGSMKQCFK